MTKICLTCKVSKSMNQAELEKVIPDWYKEIGNYSLLPPILNNNDKYNAQKTTLQLRKPDITDYEVKVDIKSKKNTWICYWAANYTDDYNKIKTAKQAYDKFQNHGLVKTDESGKAVLTLNCPQPYSVDGITYPRHVHYCHLNKNNLWSDDIQTVIVSCDVDFKSMKKMVKDKCHLIINVLSKDSFDRCKIPGSINIPLLTFQRDDVIETIRKSLNDFNTLKKFKGKRIFETPIIVYCKDTSCKASEKMIELLIEVGFRNLLEYSEGVMGWMRKSKSDKCDLEISGGGDKESEESEESEESDDSKKSNDSKESEESEESEESKESEESDDSKKSKKPDDSKSKSKSKSKSHKSKNMFDLSSNFETIVYDNKKYQHDIKTGDILVKGTIVGEYDDDRILFKKDFSSDEESEYSSDEEEIRDELDTVKKDVDSIKYRKHKISLVCMNDITPKIYDEHFRGWGFTFWTS